MPVVLVFVDVYCIVPDESTKNVTPVAAFSVNESSRCTPVGVPAIVIVPFLLAVPLVRM